MKNFSLSVFILLVLSFFFSCEDKEEFSSDPNLKLSFSKDTVQFDTVFTTIGSSTRLLKVYNNNDKGVTIQSVELVGAEKSGFRMNVDGVSGNLINNVDIFKRDSMHIFIEVTVDPLNSQNPLLIRDSIKFTLNGRIQYVQLEAIGQDVYIWKGKTFEQDTTLTGEKPFLIRDSLVIKSGVTLNIEKNVRFFFHQNASVKVFGTIHAKGTFQEPIVFRGDRTDNLFTNVPYDRVPGQWNGISVDSASYDNYFENVHVRNSVNGFLFKPSKSTLKKATFINSIVHNTTSNGISAVNCNIDGYNSLFSNAGGSVIKLIGGSYQFRHCTLANYMSWWGMSKNAALIIGNVTDQSQPAPLNKCEFINSIIAGLSSSELKFQNKINGNTANIPFRHLFVNCLIKSGGEDDSIFINNIWKVDPEFKNINRNKDYLYSFELDSISPAINMADRFYSTDLPLDIRLISRLNDENPDMGCFEWVGVKPSDINTNRKGNR